jgi:hypothetical protein
MGHKRLAITQTRAGKRATGFAELVASLRAAAPVEEFAL